MIMCNLTVFLTLSVSISYHSDSQEDPWDRCELELVHSRVPHDCDVMTELVPAPPFPTLSCLQT